METKEKIIDGSGKLFFEYGIKKITMDDIAKSLTMSKKTLYQYYKTKEELVNAFLIKIQDVYEKELWEISNNSKDIIEEFAKLSKFIKDNIVSVNPSFVFDLRKYYPKSYNIFLQFKWSFMVKYTSKIIERGIKEGIFRNDIEPEIISRMRVEQVEMAFNTEIYPKENFNPRDVHIQLFTHFIYGLCTFEGHKKLNDSEHLQKNI